MISFDEWNEIYRKIVIELSKDIDNSTADLLSRLNKLMFHYNREKYAESEKVLPPVNEIITILETLLAKRLLKNNKELSASLKKMFLSAQETQLGLLVKIKVNEIKTAIDNNEVDKARKLLHSDFVTKNKSRVTSELLSWYCYNVRDENVSCLAIQLLLEIKADFNSYNYGGDTPLLLAVEHNKSPVVLQALIAAGADVNRGERHRGVMPLRIAAWDCNPAFVRILLAAGANTKLKDVAETLHAIIDSIIPEKTIENKLLVIELLVKAGVDIDILDYRQKTPLENALLRGSWEIVDLLLTLGAKKRDGLVSAAIASNNVKFLRQLIDKHKLPLPADIPYVRSRSSFSCERGSGISQEMFQLCLANGMSLKNYSLAHPVVLSSPEAVKYCISRDKKLDISFDKSPIPYGLLGDGGSPGEGAKCYLAHLAAACATRDSLAILIGKGLDIHVKDSRGFTPLHYAAAYSNEEAVKILILAGADTNAIDNEGQTPLHWSVQNGMAQSTKNIPCARVLLYAGADPNIRNKVNRKPLDCLYTDGCNAEERISAWKKAFETEKRSSLSPANAAVTTLFQTAATSAIINSNKIIRNLAYRKTLPEDASSRIEAMASRLFTPQP